MRLFLFSFVIGLVFQIQSAGACGREDLTSEIGTDMESQKGPPLTTEGAIQLALKLAEDAYEENKEQELEVNGSFVGAKLEYDEGGKPTKVTEGVFSLSDPDLEIAMSEYLTDQGHISQEELIEEYKRQLKKLLEDLKEEEQPEGRLEFYIEAACLCEQIYCTENSLTNFKEFALQYYKIAASKARALSKQGEREEKQRQELMALESAMKECYQELEEGTQPIFEDSD